MTPLSDVTLEEVGLKAVFECQVSKQGLKPTWLLNNDKALKRGVKYDIQSTNGTHTLTIEEAKSDDIAEYTIRFDEGAESTAKLDIHGKGPS